MFRFRSLAPETSWANGSSSQPDGRDWIARTADAEIARLSVSRQILLADLMSASDEDRRIVSEFIHDGPLQSVLMARQDISGVLKKNPYPALERTLEGLREATGQMREATFELHPAVLAGAGLARPTRSCSVSPANCCPTSCVIPRRRRPP